jgi:hypothetical protein
MKAFNILSIFMIFTLLGVIVTGPNDNSVELGALLGLIGSWSMFSHSWKLAWNTPKAEPKMKGE